MRIECGLLESGGTHHVFCVMAQCKVRQLGPILFTCPASYQCSTTATADNQANETGRLMHSSLKASRQGWVGLIG